MVERHKSELAEALPEVDIFLGASETDMLIEVLSSRGLLDDEPTLTHPGVRLYTGDAPHAALSQDQRRVRSWLCVLCHSADAWYTSIVCPQRARA